ncbi:tetratricopeptide repeat protein [Phenylobacterium sp.]|uniref:tetratricopeptide repeat protein n=1 Tax=Phenylobacterium sp. TaxID=1871053 RepID=UPI00391DBB63
MDEFDLAVAEHRAGRLDAAERGYRSLPESPKVLHNLGVLLIAQERFDEAEAVLKRVLELDPGNGPSAFSLAMQLLARGAYAEAWPHYEGRRRQPGLHIPSIDHLPEWRGEDLAGKRLVVLGEQGFGDQIQFARFLPMLPPNAGVTYVCSPPLMRLMQNRHARLAPGIVGAAPFQGDYWVLLGSLPLRLGVTLENLPPPLPTPVVWRGRGGGVGVIARGRPSHTHDAHRSLDPASTRRLLGLGLDLAPEATGARDFADTALIVAGLDLVITVDTSVAHLAASMGAPTWVLLPRRGLDWRWLRDRADSPWYPTVRLFRQREAGDWASVLDEVEAELAALGLRKGA